jgi:hypothetical protein
VKQSPKTLLPVALGLADGILNALTLASASLVGNGVSLTVSLAIRISIAALVTAGFSVFVGAYAEARGGLRHASQQLSLPADHALADTALGRRAVIDAGSQAVLASISSMLGALIPLLIAIVLPGPGCIAAVIAIAALGGARRGPGPGGERRTVDLGVGAGCRRCGGDRGRALDQNHLNLCTVCPRPAPRVLHGRRRRRRSRTRSLPTTSPGDRAFRLNKTFLDEVEPDRCGSILAHGAWPRRRHLPEQSHEEAAPAASPSPLLRRAAPASRWPIAAVP